MHDLILLGLICFVVVLGLGFGTGRISRPSRLDFDSRIVWSAFSKSPLSNVEQILFYRISEALPEHVVLAQVQLIRFIGIRKSTADWRRQFGSISQKSIDYLICDKALGVIAAVELDDSTHNAVDRQKSDAIKSAVLAAAGIRLVRWNVKALPNAAEIRSTIGASVPGLAPVPLVAPTGPFVTAIPPAIQSDTQRGPCDRSYP